MSSTSSEISISGVFTFVIVVVAGPCYYALEYLKHYVDDRRHNSSSEESRSILQHKKQQYQHHHQNNNYRLSLDSSSSSEYLFGLLAMAINLVNIWRFPYVIASNGGSAALLVYVILTLLVATPLFLYEQIIGQYINKSTIQCYTKINTRWTSIGWASTIFLLIVASYQAMIVAYSIPYLFQSMLTPLPWTTTSTNNNQEEEEYWFFDSVLNTDYYYYDQNNNNTSSPSSSSSLLGPIQSNLALSLLIIWILVFFICGFGKYIMFKVYRVTIVLPVILMLVLVLRSIFLEGASDGMEFYLGRLDYSYLLSMKTWSEVCGQTLFSLMTGFGVILTYSSFIITSNNKNKDDDDNVDIVRVCRIVVSTNVVFSIVTGIAIFCILGHISYQESKDIEELIQISGAGLVYVTIADAMEYFGPLANVMSVLFFSMILLVGLDSLVVWITTLSTYVNDYRYDVGWSIQSLWRTTLLITVSLYFVGLFYTTQMGFYALMIVDHFISNIYLLLLISFQSIMLNIDFGFDRLNFVLTKLTHGFIPNNLGGRSLQPTWFYRLHFSILAPILPAIFGLYLIVDGIMHTFQDYPKEIVFCFGWLLLIIMIAVTVSTLLWRRNKGESSLPPYNSRDNDAATPSSPSKEVQEEEEGSETIGVGGSHEESIQAPDDNDDNNKESKETLFSETATRYFLVWVIWLFAGTIFYGYAPGSSLGLGKGFYMAVNIGYSIGFGYPSETDQGLYLLFSTCYVLVGASLVSVALGFFADKIVDESNDWYINMLRKKEYKRKTAPNKNWSTRIKAWFKYHKEEVRSIGLWLFWVVLMITYSTIRIGWPYLQAQYFAISAMSTGGHWSIPEDSPGWFFGITGIIVALGVPIMGVAMATIGSRIATSKKAKLEDMQSTINSPVTPRELRMLQRFGLEDGDGEVDEAECIILCMCRLGTDPRIIENIGERFRQLDADGSGALNLREVCGTDTLADLSDHDYGNVSLSDIHVSERGGDDDVGGDSQINRNTMRVLSSPL